MKDSDLESQVKALRVPERRGILGGISAARAGRIAHRPGRTACAATVLVRAMVERPAGACLPDADVLPLAEPDAYRAFPHLAQR